MNPDQQEAFNKLTTLQQNVALKKLEGLSDIEAYRQGGGKAKTVTSQESAAHEILRKHEVEYFISLMRQDNVKETIMKRDEALEILTAMARGKLHSVEEISSTDIRGAAKQLADMEGWNAAQRTINLNQDITELKDDELDRRLSQLEQLGDN